MSEENEPINEGGSQFTPITSQEQLDKLIGGRINQVKAQFADYEDLRNKAAEYDKAQESAKTESQKLAEERDTFKSQAEKAAGDLMRLQIGLDKGLTPAQARRLVGATKEDLEADADDLLATFGGGQSAANTSSTSSRPTENLRGGGDPDTEPDPDLSKVIADIPRR